MCSVMVACGEWTIATALKPFKIYRSSLLPNQPPQKGRKNMFLNFMSSVRNLQSNLRRSNINYQATVNSPFIKGKLVGFSGLSNTAAYLYVLTECCKYVTIGNK